MVRKHRLTIEVPAFFATFALTLSVAVTTNLLMFKTCYVLLNYNKSECALLGFENDNKTQDLEELVQPKSTYIAMVKTIMEAVLGSVLCLFIAPWSDRFGRKPVIVLGFAGSIVASLLHIAFAAFEDLTPWTVLVLTIPVLVTGGAVSFNTILFAYITDKSTKVERAMRMGMLEISIALATSLGNSTSTYILNATSYVSVYCIAMACYVVALVYTIFLIPESLKVRETANPIAGFFAISNFIEMTKTPFKPRGNSTRTILLLIMVSMLLGYLATGADNIFFFFLREKLQWTLTHYTWYNTIKIILGVVGATVVVYWLHTVRQIKEPILMFFGASSAVVSLITFGFSVEDWQIYLGAILGVPFAGQTPLMRAMISKLVHEEEIAKVMSAFSIGSNILGPLGSAGYTALYNATLSTDSGLFNFVTAAINICAAFVFLIVLLVQRKSSNKKSDILDNNDIEQNGSIEADPENLIISDVNQEEILAER